jgi:18S rRNA (guanine1575-N7)-methyltransferase
MIESEDSEEMEVDGPQSEYDSDESDDESDDEDDDEDEEEGDLRSCVDLFHHDMGEGTCVRPGTFDGCISISALQWLCHSNKSCENPKSRLNRLFSTLFGSLSRGARAVFQFYPETSSQVDLILGCAMKAGFTGGLVVDFPNSTKAKKYYLCLMTGPSAQLPQALDEQSKDHQVSIDKRSRKRQRDSKRRVHDKSWIMGKKNLARKRGEDVKSDSKYTARKRRIKF